jgi:hypothetical protein
MNKSEIKFLQECLEKWENVSGYNYHGMPSIYCLKSVFDEIKLRIEQLEEGIV